MPIDKDIITAINKSILIEPIDENENNKSLDWYEKNRMEIFQNALNDQRIKNLLTKREIEHILAYESWQRFLSEIQIENLIISVHNQVITRAISNGVQFWRTGNSVYYRLIPFDKKKKLTNGDDLVSILNFRFKLFNKIEDIEYCYGNTLFIVINLLDVVEEEIFYVYESREWVYLDNKKFKNLFKYTNFLKKRFCFIYEPIGNMQNNTYYPKTSLPMSMPQSYQMTNYSQPIEIFPIRSTSETDYFSTSLFIDELQQNTVIVDFFRKVTSSIEHSNFILNWLNSYFNTLLSSGEILILVGDSETTDIIINKIIKPIFIADDEYLYTINDENIDKDIPKNNKLFYHFNNISEENTYKKHLSKDICEILSNRNTDDFYKFYNGEIIITTDKDTPYPFLKDVYNHCKVFEVNNLSDIIKSFNVDKLELINLLKSDLNNFTNILRYIFIKNQMPVLNTRIDTESKEALKNMKNGILLTRDLTNKIDRFAFAIKNLDTFYFKTLEGKDADLYKELEENFQEKMIAQKHLGKYFDLVYNATIFKDKNAYLIDLLKQKYEMYRYSPSDATKKNGSKRYVIY